MKRAGTGARRRRRRSGAQRACRHRARGRPASLPGEALLDEAVARLGHEPRRDRGRLSRRQRRACGDPRAGKPRRTPDPRRAQRVRRRPRGACRSPVRRSRALAREHEMRSGRLAGDRGRAEELARAARRVPSARWQPSGPGAPRPRARSRGSPPSRPRSPRSGRRCSPKSPPRESARSRCGRRSCGRRDSALPPPTRPPMPRVDLPPRGARTARPRRRTDGGGRANGSAKSPRRTNEALDCPPAEAVALRRAEPADAPLPNLGEIETRLERLPPGARAARGRQSQGRGRGTTRSPSGGIALVGERDDLVAAIQRLRQGIASLNREGRERLPAAFEHGQRPLQAPVHPPLRRRRGGAPVHRIRRPAPGRPGNSRPSPRQERQRRLPGSVRLTQKPGRGCRSRPPPSGVTIVHDRPPLRSIRCTRRLPITTRRATHPPSPHVTDVPMPVGRQRRDVPGVTQDERRVRLSMRSVMSDNVKKRSAVIR